MQRDEYTRSAVTLSSENSRLSLVAAGVLVVLLAVLASMQYRWLGQVAAAERDRTRARLAAAASGFAADFDREVGHVAACLGSSEAADLPETERVARRYDCLVSTGALPMVANRSVSACRISRPRRAPPASSGDVVFPTRSTGTRPRS